MRKQTLVMDRQASRTDFELTAFTVLACLVGIIKFMYDHRVEGNS